MYNEMKNYHYEESGDLSEFERSNYGYLESTGKRN